MTKHIVSIKKKKSAQKYYPPGHVMNEPCYFAVDVTITRDEFVKLVKEFDDDLDLRTVRFFDEVVPNAKFQYLEGFEALCENY